MVLAGVLVLSSAMQAQQREIAADAPWSVRMAQSEMARCPQAWQLDFVKKPMNLKTCSNSAAQAFKTPFPLPWAKSLKATRTALIG